MLKIAENKNDNIHKGHRERLKERFVREGIESFEDHEALEMLLFYALPQRDTNALAHRLISKFGSLAGVFDATVESLQSVNGVGKNTAVLIKLIPAMYAKYLESSIACESLTLESAEQSGSFFVSKLMPYSHEVLMAAFLDNRLCIKNVEIISEGTDSRTELSYRKIINKALNLNAPNIIIAHNHPSGVAAPSANDIEAVRELSRMLTRLDLHLKDSIIVAGENYFSMAGKAKFSYLFT